MYESHSKKVNFTSLSLTVALLFGCCKLEAKSEVNRLHESNWQVFHESKSVTILHL